MTAARSILALDETQEATALAWSGCSRSPWDFALGFCYTLNQHAPEGTTPTQPFPDRPHLRALTSLWSSNRLLFVEKSRQMLVTWWASYIALYSVLFRQGQLIYVQSKKLEDAVGNEYTGDGLLGRAKFMLNHIPWRERFVAPLGVEISTERILVKSRNSAIQAIAQGGHMIRSHTASGLISDETAFQDEFPEAFAATMASIRRGWAVWITTPHLLDGGQSMRICRDLEDGQS